MCDYIYSINIYEQFYDPNDAKSKICTDEDVRRSDCSILQLHIPVVIERT